MCWRNGQNIGIKSTVSISKDKKCYQNQYYVWSLLTLTPYCTRCLIDKMMRQITAYGMLIHSSCKAGGGGGSVSVLFLQDELRLIQV